jgi:hypothetical protein
VNWQVKFALENLNDRVDRLSGQHVTGDIISLSYPNQPSVLAAISSEFRIDANKAKQIHVNEPKLDFLCGYRKECIWEGDAIIYLKHNGIGWGSLGTLRLAVREGNANTAEHKDFSFSDRLLRQSPSIKNVEREFDRIYRLHLQTGRVIRIGMVHEYEPTADVVRSLWDTFGAVEVIWNINPNGRPTTQAIIASEDLGCEILRWEDLKLFMRGKYESEQNS